MVRDQFSGAPPPRLGVAVSGGGDSVALLHILTRCFAPEQTELSVATVDHGLRPEAAIEADQVRDMCDALGITHSKLRWRGWDGVGNLQEKAREARFKMLSDWAHMQDLSLVLLGHTADDQAETLLMRLARLAGVNGLSGMPTRRTINGVTFMRPMLGLTRAQLRAYLLRHGIGWAEDPSNDDDRFDRVKARRALAALEDLGVTASGLSQVAANLRQARDALDWYSFLAARDLIYIQGGCVVLDQRMFRTLPVEVARRLVVQSVRWISRSEHPPRRSAVENALTAIRQGHAMTMAGCHIVTYGKNAWICREHKVVSDETCETDALWDGRWTVRRQRDVDGCHMAALGAGGLVQCPDWREFGIPRAAQISGPAIWRQDELVAAPLARNEPDWEIALAGDSEDFYVSLLSH